MTITTMLVAAMLVAAPLPSDGTAVAFEMEMPSRAPFEFELVRPAEPVAIDFELAIAEAVQAVANGWQDRDPNTGQFVANEPERGYFKMLYQDTYDPAVLSYFASSAVEMYTAWDLRNQCAASAVVSCSDPWPSSVQMDAMLTAGVYAGVIGLQRLAKTQWDVDLDEGWKSLLIWGGIAAGRALVSASNISDANALREFGR